MAKKKDVNPFYSEAPLVIPRERFCELLSEQIKIGGDLLKIVVPQKQPADPYYGFTSVHRDNKVEYEETEKNDFVDNYKRWNDRNKAIYRTSFSVAENIYYHEYESNIWNSILTEDIIKTYKSEIKRLINHMRGDIERADLIKFIATEKDNKAIEPNPKKTPMVFISHSSKDKQFAEALVVMLEDIGFDSTNLFCSSVDGYGVGLSKDIFETLRELFREHNLFVIFVHSPRYYTSPISLNEMGAAWVLRNDFCSFLTTDMDFSLMKGVVNGSAISIKVDADDAPSRLTELKDKLTQIFKLAQIDAIKWERKRNSFLNAVKALQYSEESVSIISPLDDEYKRLQVEKLKQEALERKQAKVRGNVVEGRSPGARILKIFNAGQSKANNVIVEWLNPDDQVILKGELGALGEISPQSNRSFNMALCMGHPDTMRLRYTWSDANEVNNTYEEDIQL